MGMLVVIHKQDEYIKWARVYKWQTSILVLVQDSLRSQRKSQSALYFEVARLSVIYKTEVPNRVQWVLANESQSRLTHLVRTICTKYSSSGRPVTVVYYSLSVVSLNKHHDFLKRNRPVAYLQIERLEMERTICWKEWEYLRGVR